MLRGELHHVSNVKRIWPPPHDRFRTPRLTRKTELVPHTESTAAGRGRNSAVTKCGYISQPLRLREMLDAIQFCVAFGNSSLRSDNGCGGSEIHVPGRDQGHLWNWGRLRIHEPCGSALQLGSKGGRHGDSDAQKEQGCYARYLAPVEGRLLFQMERRQRELLHSRAGRNQIHRP